MIFNLSGQFSVMYQLVYYSKLIYDSCPPSGIYNPMYTWLSLPYLLYRIRLPFVFCRPYQYEWSLFYLKQISQERHPRSHQDVESRSGSIDAWTRHDERVLRWFNGPTVWVDTWIIIWKIDPYEFIYT